MKASAVLLAFAALIIAGLFSSAPAQAAAHDLFSRFGETGSGAGQMARSRGIATNPDTGHVYVTDELNNRVNEFTAWGVFVKAWGWGVADGSNELQVCTQSTGCQEGLPGAAAGQFDRPTGMAIDHDGDIYIFEDRNLRVQKFNADGEFLRAFGGDVVAEGPGNSGNNEVQEITIAASGGTFRLGLSDPFNGGPVKQTPALAYNAGAAAIESVLNALPSVAENGGMVAVSGGPGDATGSKPYFVTFQGKLAGNNVPQLVIERANLGPPTIGARLVCSTETEAATIQYRWLRNGAEIPGATLPSYTTTASDEGKAIQCQTTAIGGRSGATQVATPATVAPPQPSPGAPIAPQTIAAPASENLLALGTDKHELTCNPSSDAWQGASSFAFSWYRNGQVIPDATEAKYTVTKGQLTSTAAFQCGVTATSTTGASTTKISQNALTYPAPNGYFTIEATASMEPITTVSQGGGPEVCVVTNGDVCQAGTRGSRPGEFGVTPLGGGTFNDYIDVGPSNHLYVADRNRIQRFQPDGTFDSEIPLPEEGNPASMAVDPTSGSIYFTYLSFGSTYDGYAGDEERIHCVLRLNPTTGKIVSVLKVQNPTAIAVDTHENVFVFDERENTDAPDRIMAFDSTGTVKEIFGVGDITGINSTASGMATNVVSDAGDTDLYVASTFENIEPVNGVLIYGSPPSRWPPPVAPPKVTAAYTAAVGSDDATVIAEINPSFWADTKYYLQYGTSPCSAGGCIDLPAAPGKLLTDRVTDTPVRTPAALISGLDPGTTYYYRFVAESSGGGPVVGEDQTFKTFLPAISRGDDCQNGAFRTGAAATLPNCRAYEMVSPLDKNNGDVRPVQQITGYSTGLSQSATDGSALTYSSYRSFGDAKAAPYVSQYLSRRTGAGWTNEILGPPRTSPSVFTTLYSLENEFRAFSDDLKNGWLLHDTEPTLDPDAPAGFAGLYRRDNVSGDFESLSNVAPPTLEASLFNPELQAVTADGSSALFSVNDKLTPDASIEGNYQVYMSSNGGELHLVSVLPNGEATTGNATAGGPSYGGRVGRFHSVHNALSADGTRAYWTEEGGSTFNAGTIYLRNNPGQPQSAIAAGKCTEPERACTVPVSETVSALGAHYETASVDGSRAIFKFEEGSRKGDLYEFDAKKRKSTLIAHKVRQSLLGASDDASRMYFASEEVLSGANAEGKTPVANLPNLYFFDAKAATDARYRFIGILTTQDVDASGSSLAPPPFFHTGRVNPGGDVALFLSNARLTSYDNKDLQTGVADAEVYRYDARANEGKGRLLCLSCNPSGARPIGRNLADAPQGETIGFRAAAMIPTAPTLLYTSRVVSDDGERVVFNAYDSLTRGDTNGKADVYQWEAPGKGECEEGSPDFSETNGGCIVLISSGESATDSEFVDMSSSGNDIFFTTLANLVPQDYGLIDVYDARVEGGFPAPPGPPVVCEGEACQGPLAPPNDPTPGSSSFEGPGNASPGKKPGARKKKARHKKVQHKGRGHKPHKGSAGRKEGAGR